jgi:hypothetical protein
MPVINTIAVRDTMTHLVTRDNFASREPGVITVFAILGAVAIGMIIGIIYKWNLKRQANKPNL